MNGYVLAGGASWRFGLDKARVELGGRPMLLRMVELVSAVAKSTQIVAMKGKYGEFGVSVVADCWPGEGPLGGIITALEASAKNGEKSKWNLIISCDMPFLTAEWLSFLTKRAQESDSDVVWPHSASGPEPLCACWRTQAVNTLRPAFGQGVRKVMDGVKQLKAEVLDEKDWKRFDSAGRLFWNMNTQADYEEARRILETEKK